MDKPMNLDEFVRDTQARAVLGRPGLASWMAKHPEIKKQVDSHIIRGTQVITIFKWLKTVPGFAIKNDWTFRKYANALKEAAGHVG